MAWLTPVWSMTCLPRWPHLLCSHTRSFPRDRVTTSLDAQAAAPAHYVDDTKLTQVSTLAPKLAAPKREGSVPEAGLAGCPPRLSAARTGADRTALRLPCPAHKRLT